MFTSAGVTCVSQQLLARALKSLKYLLTARLYGFTLGIERTGMKPEQQRDLFPGALEMMILQTLRRGAMHGYALAQLIKRTSDELLQVEEGSLYPALQRMLKAGWVAAEWGVSSRNRRVRIYKITPAGRKQLEREVSSFERMFKGITRVMKPAES